MCTYVCVFVVPECLHVYYMQPGSWEGQKRSLSSLDLELQTVVSCLVWVLGIELGSSERAVFFLTSEINLQSPSYFFFFFFLVLIKNDIGTEEMGQP